MKTPKIEKRPGVYQITNLVNGHRYIGSSVNVYKRLRLHKWMLKRGIHENGHLQHAYNKYGVENFTASVLLYCERDETLEKEQKFLDKLKPEYNTAKNTSAPALGLEVSAGTRAKLSENSKRLWQNEEYREKMTKSAKDRQQSEEYKAKMSASCKAVWQDEEYKERMSKKASGARKSEEFRAMIGEKSKKMWQERKSDPEAMAEWKAKQSKALTGRKLSEETKAKMSKAKHNMSEETKAKISEALKGRELSDEHKANLKAAHQRKKELQDA